MQHVKSGDCFMSLRSENFIFMDFISKNTKKIKSYKFYSTLVF